MSDDKTRAKGAALATAPGAGALANRVPTPFSSWQHDLETAPGGAALLDRIISPHDATALVPQLSVDDLFGYIRRIGLQDADSVLALASGAQVQGLLDTDVWTRDELQMERVDPWLHALMRAGPEVLGPRILDLDDSMITHLLRSSVHVMVIEDPEDFDAPDMEHVLTPDGRLCICFPNSAPRDLPIKIFLDWLIQMKPVYCMNLLVFSTSALESNLTEDAYRWRSGRMADRGYVDYYDALRVYVPATKQQLSGAIESAELNDTSRPVVHHWLTPLKRGSQRLEAALATIDSDALAAVQSSLAYTMNMALSADRVELWDDEHQDEILLRVRAGLTLALDAVNGPNASAEQDAHTLSSVPISLLFRIGYGRMLDAAGPARSAATVRNLRGDGGRVDAMDLEGLRPWAEWLTARHPMLPDGQTPTSPADLETMNSHAQRIADLARVAGSERPLHVGVGQLLLTRFVCALLGLESQGPLPLDQLVNAHALLVEDGEVPVSTRDAAYVWWLEQGGHQRESVHALLDEMLAQLGGVNAQNLDPKHIPLLWFSAD